MRRNGGSELRFGDQVTDFDLEEGHSRWSIAPSSSEGALTALVKTELNSREPANAVLQRTLVEFNGKVVPPDCKGAIVTTNRRFLAPKVVCFRPFTPKRPDVRQAAAEALVKIGTPVVEPLIAVLRHSDSDVHSAAAKALDELGWKPDKSEIGACYWIGKREWDKCVEIGTPAVEPLIAALWHSDKSVRRNAAKTLGKLGDMRAVEPLIAALQDSSSNLDSFVPGLEELSSSVMHGIARSLIKKSADALLVILKDRVPSFRQAAKQEAIELLLPKLKDTRTSNDKREEATSKLQSLGWKPENDFHRVLLAATNGEFDKVLAYKAEAVKPLLIVLTGYSRFAKDEEAARASLLQETLVRLGNSAVDPLIRALEDKEFVKVRTEVGEGDKRSIVAQALGQIGDVRAIKSLIATLKDSYGHIHMSSAGWAAKKALEAIVNCNAEHIAVEDLYTLAQLEVNQVTWTYEEGRFDDDRYGGTEISVSPVDCSQLRQLARQELIRRGIET